MNFKRLKYTLLCAALLLSGAGMGAYAAPWEQLKADRTDAKTVVKEENVEVKSARLAIIVSVPKATAVKVYTILGQLVSSETIPAGISQLHIPSHGVYIVKIGSLTCKVAL